MPIVISPNLVQGGGASSGGGVKTDPCIAFIGYDNYIYRGAEITASSAVSGFPVSALYNPLTYERWLASSTDSDPTVTIDLGANQDINYVAIGAHTLHSSSATEVIVESSIDANDWDLVEAVNTSSNNALMFVFKPITARYWRIRLGAASEIGSIYIGEVLQMPVQMYGGHTPGTLARQTVVNNNESVAGQFLGRSIVRQGYATDYTWKRMPALWYRINFDPFVEHATKYPFFIAWNYNTFADEVLYGWTTDDIAPTNMGVRDLMQVSMSVEAVR